MNPLFISMCMMGRVAAQNVVDLADICIFVLAIYYTIVGH